MRGRRRARHALLAALAFLVLAQGYRLATGAGPGLPALLAVAAVVGTVAAVLAAATEALLARRSAGD